MTKIFFDISGLVLHLRHSRTYSGIQRTVVNLIAETAKLLESDNVYASYYDRSQDGYVCFCLKDIAHSVLLDPLRLKSAIGGRSVVRYGFSALRQYEHRPLKYFFHEKKFAFHAFISNNQFFSRRSTSIKQWKEFRAGAIKEKRITTQSFASIATKGDHLILLDSSWSAPRSIPHFEAANGAGLDVHVLVHDLIPIVRPDLVPDDAPFKLYDWLISTARFANSFLANSEVTRTDFAEFLELHGVKKQISVLPLAQDTIGDFKNINDTTLFADRKLLPAYKSMAELSVVSNPLRGLESLPYVLCVGSLETRKNNWRIASAWALLRETVPVEKMPRLVFAGQSGWMNNDFNDLMQGTGNLWGHVHVISGPTDDELAFLYRNCQFTIMASLYEGWGLPVGESLSFGKTAVVSNTSSLPEVGGDLVRYCDPMSPNSIMQACKDLIMNPNELAELEARIRKANLRKWSDVATEMIAATVRRKG